MCRARPLCFLYRCRRSTADLDLPLPAGTAGAALRACTDWRTATMPWTTTRGDGGRRPRDGDLLRNHQEVVGERRISGGMVAEKNRVWRGLGRRPDDTLDVRDEAHVEHAVGFVDHQDLEVVQQQPAALELVEQASRRGDQHVDAAVRAPSRWSPMELSPPMISALEAMILAVVDEVLGDLRRQLPRRLQDQRARHARLGPAAPGYRSSAG